MHLCRQGRAASPYRIDGTTLLGLGPTVEFGYAHRPAELKIAQKLLNWTNSSLLSYFLHQIVLSSSALSCLIPYILRIARGKVYLFFRVDSLEESQPSLELCSLNFCTCKTVACNVRVADNVLVPKMKTFFFCFLAHFIPSKRPLKQSLFWFLWVHHCFYSSDP